MKVFKFFVLFSFVAAFVSCSSDDDTTPPPYEFNKDHLSGKYNLEAFKSKDIKKRTIDGFDVTTTTTSEASTINFSYEFSSNNLVVLNGNYLITETRNQGDQVSDTTYIVNMEQVELPYSINKEKLTLTIDGLTYQVSGFNANGLKLNAQVEEPIENGTREYTEEIQLRR